MREKIKYLKFKKRFKFLPIRAGSFFSVLRHNSFLDRREPFGFKLKNLEPRRLMEADAGLPLLLLLRRLGRETYRRLSYKTEVQYNVVKGEVIDNSHSSQNVLETGRIYHKSGRYQAYVGRIVGMRNRLTANLTVRALTHGARNIYYPYATYNYNRFDFFTRLSFRRKKSHQVYR